MRGLSYLSPSCAAALVGLYDTSKLDPQTWQVARDICRTATNTDDPTCLNDGRTIDYLLISVGGNDIGFSDIIAKCVVDMDCYNNVALVSNTVSGLLSLPSLYD